MQQTSGALRWDRVKADIIVCRKLIDDQPQRLSFDYNWSLGQHYYLSCLMTKPTKWHVCPAKTHISLGTRPVWSESSLCAQWVAKNPSFLHVDSEDWSDWADAEADLSLRWAHMPYCWLCYEAAQFWYSRLASANFPPGHFSHIFIDEAGHAVETETMIAISGIMEVNSGQIVLAGDPKQLGPILRSPYAIKYGLGNTFFYEWNTYDGYYVPHRRGGGHIVFGADPVGVSGHFLVCTISHEPVGGFQLNLHGCNIGTWWRIDLVLVTLTQFSRSLQDLNCQI